MPDRVRAGALRFRQHEGFWRPALAGSDLLHGPPRGDRFVLVQDVVGLAFFGIFVAVLDQQPIGPFSPIAIPAHPHQHPTAVQLVAVQREFQVALLESFFGIVGLPIAAIPELHRAAAVLALRYGAFEIAVVERMILHLDGQPLVARIERRTLGHRPGLEDAVEFEPEIVMQSRRRMLLDHEAAALRWCDLGVAAWLRGFLEIAFLAVGDKLLEGHGAIPRK